MKKLSLYIFLVLMWCNVGFAVDINLYCATTNMNTRDVTTKEVEYKELRPSHFTVTIEITSPGKVLTRLKGSAETGYMWSPYIGTIDDNIIRLNHKHSKLKERGTDFIIDRISGMFTMNSHLDIDREDYKKWWMQKTGSCTSIKKQI